MMSSGDIFERMTIQIRKHVNIVMMVQQKEANAAAVAEAAATAAAEAAATATAEVEGKRTNERKLTALWESTKILIDDACKAYLDKIQLLLDLDVSETGLFTT